MNIEEILNRANNVKNEEETKMKMDRGGADARILRFKKGVKYYGRFVPTQDGVFASYEEVSFQSPINGEYVSLGRSYSDPELKLNSKVKDPVKALQWADYKRGVDTKDEELKTKSYKLIPRRRQAVNFYLTKVEGDDPAAKEKIGQCCIVNYVAAIDRKDKTPKSATYKKIFEGLTASKKIGNRGFIHPAHLNDGVDFCFDVIDKGGYANYDQSDFDLKNDSDLVLTKEDVVRIYENAHNLNEFIPELKDIAEIEHLLDIHYRGTSAAPEDEMSESNGNHAESSVDDMLNSVTRSATPGTMRSIDEDLDELLAESK